MKCEDVEHAVRNHDWTLPARLPAEVRRHADQCRRCRELISLFAQIEPLSTRSADVIRQIERRIASDLRPVKPIAGAAALAAVVSSIFVIWVVGMAALLRPWVLAAMGYGIAAAVFGVVAVCAGLLIVSLARQMVPGSVEWPSPRYLLPGVPVILAVCSLSLFPHDHVPDFWATGWTCLSHGLMFALPAGIAFFVVLRRGALMTPALTGLTAGLLAGLVGMTILEIRCPLFLALHIVIWHLGIAIIAALAGLGWSLLAQRYNDRLRYGRT